MEKIPQDMIDAIPPEVGTTRDAAQAACDPTLAAMFYLANELEVKPSMPPILSSTGVEVYPLPNPWVYSAPLNPDGSINGDAVGIQFNKWLKHVISNAEGYNEAIDGNNIPTAKNIAQQSAKDSATVWSVANSAARAVEKDSVYRAILLSDDTKEIFKSVAGPFPDWPEEEPPEPEVDPESRRRNK